MRPKREAVVRDRVAMKIYVSREEHEAMKKFAAAKEWSVPHVMRYAVRELLKKVLG